jgi:hypothetical protein
VILLFLACLPHNSLSRQAEQPSARYQLAVQLSEQSEGGLGLTWEMASTLDLAYTRTFRDRSIGTLVQFSGVEARLNGQGVPNRLEGLLVEMRAFDRGEVLAVLGADAGVGSGGNLEKFDVLWPALVPRVEGEGAELRLLTSWPVAENRDLGRSRLQAEGQVLGRDGALLSMRWEGTISQEDRAVRRNGTIQADVQVDRRNDRVVDSTWTVDRAVEVRWGARPVQQQKLVLSLHYLGDGPPLAVLPAQALDSILADAEPPTLADGRVLLHPPLDFSAQVPFLLVPDKVEGGSDPRGE